MSFAMRRWMVALSLIVLQGCASATTIPPRVTLINLPPLNTVQQGELGDTIIAKGEIHQYDAIKLLNEVHGGDGVILLKHTITPQKLIAKLEDKKWTYYLSDKVTTWDALLGTRVITGGFKIQKKNKSNIKIFGSNLRASLSPKPAPLIEHTTVEAVDEPSFKQEFIYNGRSGNNVKFLYRELAGSLLRAPFNQDVQYDLATEKVVGFKGARLEILEATNTKLQYRVINNFPEPEETR